MTKWIMIFILFINIFNLITKFLLKYKFLKHNNYKLFNKFRFDNDTNKFIILRDKCRTCGLFAYYKHYLGCFTRLAIKGYIPIIDLTFPNIFNGFKVSSLKNNPYEYFFYQPFNFTL